MTTRILVGHVLDRIAELPSDSVHCVWTSVPYWGLRSYGTEPQVWGGDPGCEHVFGGAIPGDGRRGQRGCSSIMADRSVSDHQVAGRQADRGNICDLCGAWRGEHGLEPTLDLWLAHEVLIWREIRRVLRPEGVAWLNCGDAYASGTNGRPAAEVENDDRTFRDKPVSTASGIFKPKQRLMMPARLAIALQSDGWWIRDEIVWAKRNPMPSSVRDRTTPAHEMLYLLTKRPRYFFDQVAIQEPVSGTAHARRKDGERPPTPIDGGYGFDNRVGSWSEDYVPSMRNKRSVWEIAAEPYPGAHFATAPTALVRPCILAGTSAAGVCPDCGAPWERVTERSATGAIQKKADGWATHEGGHGSIHRDGREAGEAGQPVFVTVTTGWRPTCACDAGDPVPATVLDPFGGAGTTAVVADELGRDAILIELNPDYAAQAKERIRRALGRVESEIAEPAVDLPLFAEVEA